jgi:glycosyltransferase involved in cell wall biosynthesis
MQFGLPIVATNVGDIPEIIDDGTNGRLVEPERTGELLAAITAILDDTAELERMRTANRKKSALFGADRMADAYDAIYRSIV